MINKNKMTEQEILIGNKIIAEFLGFPVSESHWWHHPNIHFKLGAINSSLTQEMCHFHENWGYLMPIVEKIEDIEVDGFKPFSVEIEENECTIKDYRGSQSPVSYNEGENKIQAVYKSVVDAPGPKLPEALST